jgi:hypothetical protein
MDREDPVFINMDKVMKLQKHCTTVELHGYICECKPAEAVTLLNRQTVSVSPFCFVTLAMWFHTHRMPPGKSTQP